MALSVEQRKRLLERRGLDSQRTRKRLAAYLSRAGLHPNDFARRINYSGVTVRFFLAGNYHHVAGNDRAFCAAANDFMDAHPLVPETEAPGRIYDTESLRILREYFYKAVDRGASYYVYGPCGVGKTFLAKTLIAELNARELSKNGNGRRAYRVYVRAGIHPTDLLKRIAAAAGCPTASSADRIITNLRFEFRNRRAAFVLDEAQNLDRACLEYIRELLDEPPHFGLLFLGSHDLQIPFLALDMRQWHRRMRAGGILPGLTHEDAAHIITAELGECSKKRIADMIEDCHDTDTRQKKDGKSLTFISAGKLFFAIDDIKALRAQKGASA